MRTALTLFFRGVLRIFFRKIEIVGTSNVPIDGGVIFVLNHANALIDPLLFMCFSPRRTSFLAKSTLFKMPILSTFVRTFEAIPVYRRKDPTEDPSKNAQTFTYCRNVLVAGGSIALFPEGVSHDDPKLRPLRSGASRIALGASTATPVQIVPAGIYYTAKGTFRSKALILFGAPMLITPTSMTPEGDPSPEAVRGLTQRLERELQGVMLQADERELLALVGSAERILSADADENTSAIFDEFERRRRIVERYSDLRQKEPKRLEKLIARIVRYEAALAGMRIPHPRHLTAERFHLREMLRAMVRHVLFLFVLFPAASAGIVLHYPAYRAAGYVATRYSRGSPDLLASVKLLGALLFFPISWLLASLWAAAKFGPLFGLTLLLLAPVLGYTALRYAERFDRFISTMRLFRFFLTRRASFQQLARERHEIRKEMEELAAELR